MEEELRKITIDDVRVIMGQDFLVFPELVKNAFCPRCGGSIGRNVTEIVEYEIYLNDLRDVILRGKCKKCGKPVSRYIETGEGIESKKRADQIWEKLNFKIEE